MSLISDAWNRLTKGKPEVKSTQAKTGAGPALAAHSKDGATKGASGQSARATKKKG